MQRVFRAHAVQIQVGVGAESAVMRGHDFFGRRGSPCIGPLLLPHRRCSWRRPSPAHCPTLTPARNHRPQPWTLPSSSPFSLHVACVRYVTAVPRTPNHLCPLKRRPVHARRACVVDAACPPDRVVPLPVCSEVLESAASDRGVPTSGGRVSAGEVGASGDGCTGVDQSPVGGVGCARHEHGRLVCGASNVPATRSVRDIRKNVASVSGFVTALVHVAESCFGGEVRQGE